jgi:hypothetical protein
MEGGRLSTQNLKGLLDASYDPKKKQVGDFVLDKELSSGTSKVYRNPETGQVVVAHRGTAGITDWGNNAVYALGGKEAYKLTSRYKEAEKVQRRAEKKYGASNVSTIGHSQGGLQSELLGGRSKEIITLNKATRPFESNRNKNQFDVRSDRDVVSGLNPFAKKSKKDVNIKAQSFNPLTEHSGDVLDRLDKNRQIGKGIYIKGCSRIMGGVIPATPQKGDILRSMEEPDDVRVAEQEDPTVGGDLLEEYQDRVREVGLLYQRLNDETEGYGEGRLVNNIRTKWEYIETVFGQLTELIRRNRSIAFTRLVLEYINEYKNRNLPFVSLQDWRGGILFE